MFRRLVLYPGEAIVIRVRVKCALSMPYRDSEFGLQPQSCGHDVKFLPSLRKHMPSYGLLCQRRSISAQIDLTTLLKY